MHACSIGKSFGVVYKQSRQYFPLINAEASKQTYLGGAWLTSTLFASRFDQLQVCEQALESWCSKQLERAPVTTGSGGGEV